MAAAADEARTRILLVVAVLALGALVFGAALLLRGGADEDLAIEAVSSSSEGAPDASVPPASFSNPAGADVEPCDEPTEAPPAARAELLAEPPLADVGDDDLVVAVLRTTCGDVELALDPGEAPTTVANFVGLAEQDYYVGVPFHRVIDGFMVQGGDPTGTGTGCADTACEERLPGYTFPDELGLAEQLVDEQGGYPRGTLAMANAGPDTNGSQFFIVQGDPGYPLSPAYAVFGHVSDGMDVVDRIAQGPAEGDRALEPTVILDVEVVVDG